MVIVEEAEETSPVVVQVVNDLRFVLGALGVVHITAVGSNSVPEEGRPGKFEPRRTVGDGTQHSSISVDGVNSAPTSSVVRNGDCSIDVPSVMQGTGRSWILGQFGSRQLFLRLLSMAGV